MTAGERYSRAAAIAAWAAVVWLLLTWTATAEQLTFGALVAVACGLALAPLGPASGPWRLLVPRRAFAVVLLMGHAVASIVSANLRLAARVWSPSRPVPSGMLVLPATMGSDGEVAATALITSLIVDNQFVDLDRSAEQYQFHAVAVPTGDRAEAISRPIERRVARVARPC